MQLCPVCDALLPPPVMRGGLPLQSCPGCAFRGIDLEQWAYPYAGEDYYASLTDAPDVEWRHPFLLHRVAGVRRYQASGRLLELGAGMGETALALAHAGFCVDAVEESAKAVSFLKKHHPTVAWHQAEIGDFLIRAPEGAYDIITLFHVLEHIPRPRRVIAALPRLLKPGGLVVIELPNPDGLHARLKGDRWHYLQRHHVNYLGLSTLRRLMADHGFSLLGHEGKYHFSHPQGVWWKDAVKFLLAKIGFADILCTWWRCTPTATFGRSNR
ncbi:MAG: class I SAM-dependent methyltransferase [Magnetococcales bacterium]|nr:class I SAM-dependent methyltransferase [Magnetococcales bacterium]